MSDKNGRSDELQSNHNQGQEDRAERREYDEPHEVEEMLFSGSKKFEIQCEDNDAYRQGYTHTREQEENSSGSCFLTSACVEYAGLSDDCHELTTLRNFRDTYVSQLPEGASAIREYYRVAPLIVTRIHKSARRAEILGQILADVRDTMALIEAGRNETAFERYRDMVTRLKGELVVS
jgi:hypothetical protein